MSQWLKVSTAVTLTMGPFVDSVDGATAEIALDITEQEVLLSKNGGAFTLKHETTHGVHDAAHNGWYTILLDTTDTNTLGLLNIGINMAGALPVWTTFQVVAAQVWDAFFGADLLDVSAVQVLGAALTETSAGYLAAGIKKLFDVASPVLTAASVNQTGDAYGVVNHADHGNAKLVRSTTPANTLDITAAGNAGIDWGNVSNQNATVNLEDSTLKVVTQTTVTSLAAEAILFLDETSLETKLPALITTVGVAGAGLTVLATAAELAKVPKSDAAVSWNATALAAINVEVDTALNTAIPGSPTADSINERVATMDTSIALLRLLIATGAVVDDNDPDPTATAFETNLTEASNDHYNGAFLVFTSGALLGQSRKIASYVGATKVITTTAFTEAPAGGDTFAILGRSE